MTIRNALGALLGLLVLAGLLLQLVPPEFPRDNPPVTAPLEAPTDVEAILRRACYDCHSHETDWPWYAGVAPASWMVARDVAAGRSRMNFSTWGDLRDGFRRRHARRIVERIEAGEMPPARYRWLHPEARLGEAELEVLRRWRDSLLARESGGSGGVSGDDAPRRESRAPAGQSGDAVEDVDPGILPAAAAPEGRRGPGP